MKIKQKETSSNETNHGEIIINEDGIIIDADENAEEIYRRSHEEITGLEVLDVVPEPSVTHGCLFQKHLDGTSNNAEMEILRGDGSIALMEFQTEPITVDSDKAVFCKMRTLEEVKPANETEGFLKAESFNDIDRVELNDMAQNIRVDTPDGQMCVAEIILDITTGHNEIEQYKEGALTLTEAIDNRLREEEKHNPDSPEVAVLGEAKDAAFGLYERAQDN